MRKNYSLNENSAIAALGITVILLISVIGLALGQSGDPLKNKNSNKSTRVKEQGIPTPAKRPVPSVQKTIWVVNNEPDSSEDICVYTFNPRGQFAASCYGDYAKTWKMAGTWKQEGAVIHIKVEEGTKGWTERWTVQGNRMVGARVEGRTKLRLTATKGNSSSNSLVKVEEPTVDSETNSPIDLGFNAYKVDEYGDFSVDDEKSRWDDFAIKLQQKPSVIGYIVVYSTGANDDKKSAIYRAWRIKHYLVNIRGIDTSRIATVYTRNSDRFQVKLFTVPQAREIRNLNMVPIRGGSFIMGSPAGEAGRRDDEGPQHPVTVKSFYMSKYEVTQALYQAVMGTNPSHFKGDNLPVEQVSWNDAKEFCTRLSEMTGRAYRLPSEAEWEYACRAGTDTAFWFGDKLTTAQANFDDRSQATRQKTTPVGDFPANKFGLHDMHGNVYEWCEDYSHRNYQGAPTDGSAWLKDKDSDERMMRGGSWNGYAIHLRSAYRVRSSPYDRGKHIGFRVVVSAP